MAVTYTDQEIATLLAERKPLPPNWAVRTRLRPKRGHKERELSVTGDDGNRFRLILRQSIVNPLGFSVILAAQIPQSNQIFRLRRYNGRSHEHTNHIEGDTFYDFHIHIATQRYQEAGLREDAYAEITNRYTDFSGALTCMLSDCSFSVEENGQSRLL